MPRQTTMSDPDFIGRPALWQATQGMIAQAGTLMALGGIILIYGLGSFLLAYRFRKAERERTWPVQSLNMSDPEDRERLREAPGIPEPAKADA